MCMCMYVCCMYTLYLSGVADTLFLLLFEGVDGQAVSFFVFLALVGALGLQALRLFFFLLPVVDEISIHLDVCSFQQA